jgi:hypothetical protein
MNEEEGPLGLFLPEILQPQQAIQQSALEEQLAALEANNTLVWSTVGYGITLDTFKTKLEKLIKDINNGYFINYSQQEYLSIASIILNNNNNNSNLLNEDIIKLLEILNKNINNKIKKMDKEVTELTNEIVEKIDKKKVYIIDGKKTLLFMPQLERQCNWSYNLLSNDLVKKFETYRHLLRSKYYMVCQYIEDLLIKKSKIQVENIKLELTIKGHYHLPINICLLNNLVKINEMKMEVEKLVKLMNSRILLDKERQFQIWEDWWTGTHERKICPIYTEFIDKKWLQFGVRWL